MKIDAKQLEACGRAAHIEADPKHADQWERLSPPFRKRWVGVARAALVAAGVEVPNDDEGGPNAS